MFVKLVSGSHLIAFVWVKLYSTTGSSVQLSSSHKKILLSGFGKRAMFILDMPFNDCRISFRAVFTTKSDGNFFNALLFFSFSDQLRVTCVSPAVGHSPIKLLRHLKWLVTSFRAGISTAGQTVEIQQLMSS